MTAFNYSPIEAGGGGPEEMEIRLWDYIDGNSGSEERSFIEQLIETNLEWKAKYQELLEVHQMVQGHIELDEPSLRFTRNVMEEIGKYQIAPAAKNYINKKVIWGIGIFFLATIVGFIIFGISQVNWSAASTIDSKYDFSKVEWQKLFNNTYTNILLMVNTVLGLMLLDMYLGKKKKKLQQQNH